MAVLSFQLNSWDKMDTILPFYPKMIRHRQTSSLRNNAFPTESLLGMRFRKGNISASLNIQLGQLARHNPQKVAAYLCKFNAKSVHLSGASVVQWVGKNINFRRERNFSKHREISDRYIFAARLIYENRLFYTLKQSLVTGVNSHVELVLSSSIIAAITGIFYLFVLMF